MCEIFLVKYDTMEKSQCRERAGRSVGIIEKVGEYDETNGETYFPRMLCIDQEYYAGHFRGLPDVFYGFVVDAAIRITHYFCLPGHYFQISKQIFALVDIFVIASRSPIDRKALRVFRRRRG